MKVTGVMLDVAGIQNYIFGTSRLRQNVAASFIVDHVISEKMFADVLNGFSGAHALDAWREGHATVNIGQNGVTVETAYIGGGNAVLLFMDADEAGEFGRRWSLKVLAEFPGLTPVVALYDGDFEGDRFADFLNGCRRELLQARTATVTLTDLPRHGITAECIYTGQSAQVFGTDIPGVRTENGKPVYLSRSALVKAEWFDDAHHYWQKKFLDKLALEFPRDFHEIAGKTTTDRKSALAVVHIDGNEIGKRLRGLGTLEEYRRESVRIGRLMEKILRRGIQCLADAIGQARINGLGPATEKDTFTTLPFRPIIVGGDDITFVCRADLGVWLTEIIFEALTKEQAGIKDPVTACAGIAIIKPSYPFQQGYELAEALCSNAKSHARHAGRVALNWLDFHILKGGTFSSLDDLRESVFAYRGNSLTGRPFALGKREEGWGLCRTSLKNIYRQEWSSSDVKKWRSLIYGQGRDLDIFRERLGEKGKSLPIPDAPGAREELGLPKPLDIIELMEIYPEELVNTECKE